MAKVPVMKISLTNATMLSVVYLAIAATVDLARQATDLLWLERVSLSMESFPARMLNVVGLYAPMHTAWGRGELSTLQVRMIYGATVVVLIFVLGALVGGAMKIVQALSA